jgi:hypothetical protein
MYLKTLGGVMKYRSPTYLRADKEKPAADYVWGVYVAGFFVVGRSVL